MTESIFFNGQSRARGRISLPFLALFALFLFCLPGQAQSPAVSCECESSSCGPCEAETGVTFYSAKCGPGLARVKSCKRPTCVPVEDQKQCFADLAAKANGGASAARKTAAEDGDAKSEAKGSYVGKVIFAFGQASVTRKSGAVEKARGNLDIFEEDVLETGANGKIKVVFLDSNELNVTPNSKVNLASQKFDPQKDSRETLLNLIHGKIRAKVRQKYDGQANRFEVRTKAATAGVRGTDFVAAFEPGKEQWVTEVYTFSGQVQLGNDQQAKQLQIPAGTFASYTVDGVPADLSEADSAPVAARGKLSPLYQMKPDRLKELDEATDFKTDVSMESLFPKRQPASSESVDVAKSGASSEAVCSTPVAKFNQCSWVCENNPAGEKKCRVDLPNVSCVRRICRANGQWGDLRRMPASKADFCEPDKAVVRECGDYW